MRRYLIAALILASFGLATATPAWAQAYKSAAGWSGGVLINTSLNDGAAGGDQSVDLKPDPTWIMSVHYDQWIGSGHVGIRARGGFSMPTLAWTQGDREIRVYTADIGILLRPVAAEADKSVLPFLAGGVGFINWGFGDGPITTFDQAGAVYGGDEALDFTATVGLGLDFITPWEWGEGPLVVRVEGRDFMQFSSPFDPVNSDGGDFGMIHNASVVLGFHTGIGILGGG